MQAISGGKRPALVGHWALVADEHALIRGGVKLLLAETVGGLSFVEVVDAQTLLKAARSDLTLDLCIVDLHLPLLQSGAALVELARLRPALPIIILSASHSPEMARRAMAFPNVHAVLSKSADLRELRGVFLSALRGERTVSSQLQRPRAKLYGLTPRQGDVHRLLCQGLNNKSIGALLGISEGTVKNHMSDIFRVLNATNRTQAAQWLPHPR